MCRLTARTLLILLISLFRLGESVTKDSDVSPSVSMRTTTVYGFLDFTTTIEQTVVVFRPSSHSPSSSSTSIQASASVRSSVKVPPTTTIRTEADGVLVSPHIFPTPTFRSKQTTSEASTPSSNRHRTGSSSALADKRRRFLAQVRRHRPQPPNNLSSSTDLPPPAAAAASGDVTKGRHADQDMAETIDVIPSKVKRYHEDITDDLGSSGRSANRLLVRKRYRRPTNHHSDVGRSSKDRLLASRNRATAKSRFSSRGRLNLHHSNTQEVAPVMSSRSHLEPISATIAEYLHVEDDVIGADIVHKSIASSPSTPEVESKVVLEGSHVVSPVFVMSEEEESSTATAPLPVTKSATGDPTGLTVPIQLSIVTSTFSLTETRLRTSLLPVYDGSSTTFYTLTHSFLVTKTVTTFQTVPSEELMAYLIPGNDSINALLPEWMGKQATGQRKSDSTDDIIDEDVKKEASGPSVVVEEAKAIVPSSTSGQSVTYSQQQQAVNPLLQNFPFLNLLGLNPYFPYGLGQMAQPQIVTTSRPVFSTSVIITSKLLPIIDGLTTSYHTIHAAASTVTHTSYETFTTQIAPPTPPANAPAGGGGGGPAAAVAGGMSTVVNPHTYVTTETQTATQVFKLMYDGYKTSYRTVSSLTHVTRTVTTFTTTTVPLYTHAPLLPFFG